MSITKHPTFLSKHWANAVQCGGLWAVNILTCLSLSISHSYADTTTWCGAGGGSCYYLWEGDGTQTSFIHNAKPADDQYYYGSGGSPSALSGNGSYIGQYTTNCYNSTNGTGTTCANPGPNAGSSWGTYVEVDDGSTSAFGGGSCRDLTGATKKVLLFRVASSTIPSGTYPLGTNLVGANTYGDYNGMGDGVSAANINCQIFDSDAPSLAITNVNSATWYHANNAPSATTTYSDSESGISKVYYQWYWADPIVNGNMSLTSSSCASGGAATTLRSAVYELTSSPTNIPVYVDGTATLRTCAIDNVGRITVADQVVHMDAKFTLAFATDLLKIDVSNTAGNTVNVPGNDYTATIARNGLAAKVAWVVDPASNHATATPSTTDIDGYSGTAVNSQLSTVLHTPRYFKSDVVFSISSNYPTSAYTRRGEGSNTVTNGWANSLATSTLDVDRAGLSQVRYETSTSGTPSAGIVDSCNGGTLLCSGAACNSVNTVSPWAGINFATSRFLHICAIDNAGSWIRRTFEFRVDRQNPCLGNCSMSVGNFVSSLSYGAIHTNNTGLKKYLYHGGQDSATALDAALTKGASVSASTDLTNGFIIRKWKANWALNGGTGLYECDGDAGGWVDTNEIVDFSSGNTQTKDYMLSNATWPDIVSASGNKCVKFTLEVTNDAGTTDVINTGSGINEVITAFVNPPSLTVNTVPYSSGGLINAADINNLRSNINLYRNWFGTSSYVWTEAIAAGGLVKGLHLAELRKAANEVNNVIMNQRVTDVNLDVPDVAVSAPYKGKDVPMSVGDTSMHNSCMVENAAVANRNNPTNQGSCLKGAQAAYNTTPVPIKALHFYQVAESVACAFNYESLSAVTPCN